MQLPGMSYDPVRLSSDVTWWPDDESFSLSRRLWTRPYRGSTWQLEDLATTGSPVLERELEDRWAGATSDAMKYFLQLVHSQRSPF